MPLGSVLGLLLFILYTSELLLTFEKYIAGYADDTTTIYAVTPRLLSRPQVMESLNQNLAIINSRCLKWHMRLNSKNTKSMVVGRSGTNVACHGDLTLGAAET